MFLRPVLTRLIYYLWTKKKKFCMHELSIALGIVKIAEEEMAKAGSNQIEAIELEIGTLAGIEFESLHRSRLKNSAQHDASPGRLEIF